MQVFAIVVSLAIAAVGIALFVRAIRGILGVLRTGQPAQRTDQPGARTATMLKETLGHTRMLQWTWVGAGHWFIFIGFGLLFFTLLTAFGQLFAAHFTLPLIGSFFLYEWISELFTAVMLVAIVAFIAYRASRPTERVRGVKGRFFGSTMWWGYFVEGVILGVGLCIMVLRGLEYALLTKGPDADEASALHFPFTSWLGEAFSGMSTGTIENLIYLVAMLKILISFIWMITISLTLTMGTAWHRFTAFFNIWFKRESTGRDTDGATMALGALKPLTNAGFPVTLDDIEDLDEDATLGVGSVEDFAWKGILDFTTCTECGRCQSQCPAWNTDKPLSPKLLITAMRDHAYAKAPYLQASEGEREALLEGNDTLVKEVERPLVGDTGDDWFYMPENGSAVIDPDVLWSCTSCGACVQQCPVDIEHVDHIVDMRRYQILVESNFPAELNGLFKGLENKGNPWNMSPNARMDWAKGLDFEVKVVGDTIESLDEVDWLFWVGCAGAYEDRAKKTTRAVAELLDMAGVSFGVLGNGETCTGDPARRAGNEFVFQGLAQQNAETFKEYKVKKVVSTCAHCFNTLKNEYKDFGVELEVVHHTQLLNRLVREGRLTPVADGEGAHKRSITYHDPCYIGRHNGVYTPPRELLQVLPGAEYREMERNSERSFCCGAGGARMWMEEKLGERINLNRTEEAVGTGADQIAVGCPFCRVMLSDGLTAAQAKGEAREEVEVLDVAQMLLASVKGEVATKAKPGQAATAKPAAKAKATSAGADGADGADGAAGASGAAAAGTAVRERDEATEAEPAAGDVTQTEDTVTATEDAGPAAKASGGSSLFDTPAAQEPAATADADASVTEEAKAAEPASSGGSLFDLGGGEPTEAKAEPAAEQPASQPAEEAAQGSTEKPAQTADLGTGGSLFDLGGDEPAAADADTAADNAADSAADTGTKSEAEPETAPTSEAGTESAAEPATDLGGGGSLFDLEAPAEPEPAQQAEAAGAAGSTTSQEAAEPSEEAEPATQQAAERATEQEAAAPAATPAQEIPEGGSLFDLEAPAEPAAPEPTKAPEPEAETEPAHEAEAGEKTEPAPEAEAGEKVEPEVEPEVESAQTGGSAPTAAPSASIPEGGSLFDIAAPEPTRAAPTQPAEPAEPETQSASVAKAEPAPEPTPEPAAETPAETSEPDGASVSAAATAAAASAGGDSTEAAPAEASAEERSEASAEERSEEPTADTPAADGAEAEPEAPTDESEDEQDEQEQSQSASSANGSSGNGTSGPAHQPKTDVDINSSGSLFDL